MSFHTIAAVNPDSFWMPVKASTIAGEVDWLFYFILWICVFFTLLIFGLLAAFVWRYRHREDNPDAQPTHTHSTALELTWSVIPTILVLLIFYFGFRGYLNMVVAPPYSYTVEVRGKMWNWTFIYPNGAISNHLFVRQNEPVQLVLASEDVIHSFFVPQFRNKKDVVPGRFNKMWFQATMLSPKVTGSDGVVDWSKGGFDIFCTEYCGQRHSEMLAKVHVLTADEWDAEMAILLDPTKQPGYEPVKYGGSLYISRGCNQCHSIDGTIINAPSWKNLYGYQRPFTDGTSVIADENYLRESIYEPNKHIVAGFSGVMPSYLGSLTERDVADIIAYMRTLSDKGGTTPAPAAAPSPDGTAPAETPPAADAPAEAPAPAAH